MRKFSFIISILHTASLLPCREQTNALQSSQEGRKDG
jgi:hypothetical protein